MVRVDNKIGGMRAPAGALMPSRSGATQNMGSNIKVVIRVRPPNSKELELNSRFVIDVVDEKMLVFDPKQEQLPFFYQGVQQPSRNLLRRANKELKFVFDHVCDQDATNIDVFEKTTKEILTSLMEGYNCSVFVYGATGAGKTFTMIGNQQNPGITYLTMDHLFYSINSFEKDREFEIGVSYIEVYNENVYDLLKPSKTPLQLREDSKYGVMIAGLTLNVIKTAQELLDMLEDGNQNRTQHPTDANAESSRSHAVFQVYITMRYRTTGQVRMVKLSMIDLAGSERASATGCVGERFKEGANINRSLLSLGNCINKLADGGSYIPYRDSKLTRLLKDSLGGNCKTVMIANVSPSSLCFEDTYNTLKYAARANKIQLSCKKNIVNGDIRASQYVKLNEELKKKVKELEAKLALSSLQPVQIVREPDLAKEKATQEWRRRIESAERAHALLESQLLGLMVRQRVLALRHRLRTRAFSHIFDLAHRSSMEAVDKMCTEEIPRHERAAESYLKHSVALDTKVLSAWSKWNDSQVKLDSLCEQTLAECPDLVDLVNLVKTQSKLRQTEAREELKHKLVYIQNDEINAFCTYTSDMPSMLKKLYFTLKGYDKVPPALTAEYLEIMKKAISAKGITWSDQDSETDNADIHFKFISSLDLEKPSSIPDFNVPTKPKDELNVTVELATTDSDTLTDTENREPNRQSGKKRRGTPIKLPNNDTIIIDDSFEALDATRTMSSAKKVKKDFDTTNDVENAWSAINPDDLNSTFVLAGKMGALQQLVKQEETQSVKKGLTDRTNLMAKSVTFGDNKAKIVKPVVGRALPVRRAGAAPPVSARAAVAPSASARAGFGSSLSRDGTPLQRNVQESVGRGKTNVTQKAVGFKAMRARERVQTHPYSRNNPFGQRR